jgi:DNA-binding transcriptional LysR family regulator
MTAPNLRALDLKLLVVFDAILRERSVVRAAERVHLSQPATSHALNRLRQRLGDQLFVRTPQGMAPTPRAEQLAGPVRRALDDLQMVLEPDSFSPATAHRRFVVAVNNYAAVVLASRLVARCRAAAPNVQLALRPSGTFDLAARLDAGEVDLAITAARAPAERFAEEVLIEDRYVAVLRRDHPAGRGGMGPAAFAAQPQLIVSSSGEDIGFIASGMAARGLTMTVGAEAPYVSAGQILAQSDMVAVLGARIAAEFRRAYPVDIRELPFEAPSLASVMVWHRRMDDQPAHRWLRGLIASVAQSA